MHPGALLKALVFLGLLGEPKSAFDRELDASIWLKHRFIPGCARCKDGNPAAWLCCTAWRGANEQPTLPDCTLSLPVTRRAWAYTVVRSDIRQ